MTAHWLCLSAGAIVAALAFAGGMCIRAVHDGIPEDR